MVMLPGHTSVGGSTSRVTVTVKLHVAVPLTAPAELKAVAVQVTVLTPTGKVLPEGRTQVTLMVPPQMLLAPTE